MIGELRMDESENGKNSASCLSNFPASPNSELIMEPELPGGQVPLDSAFYIARQPMEERAYQEILKPGALIRIKAPKQRGKTSLMSRILKAARQQHYRTIALSLQLAATTVFTDLDKFLQWFCASVGKNLGLPNQISAYWDDIFGSNYNCTDYWENYLLKVIDSPVVLALDEVDRIFQYPEIASEFFGLLRAWYEKSKYGDSGSDIWGKLRLIIVHSAEVYIPLNINQSPFNVGLSIELQEFTEKQVQNLALRYGLNWQSQPIEQLIGLVGGSPYLIQKALYHISRNDITLEELLKTAATETSIYKDHLRRQLLHLHQSPDLEAAFEQVITSLMPVELDSKQALKLQSLGLVQLQGNHAAASCNLYRQFFRPAMGELEQLSDRVQKLEQANKALEQLVKIDSLTQLANRRCFDEYLHQEWQQLMDEKECLSLILCDVDCFKIYNDTYGHLAGDDCLQKVANVIARAAGWLSNLAARYGGEEFAIILPQTTVEKALLLAEEIRSEVKGLAIFHQNSKVSQYVTLSLGVTGVIPQSNYTPAMLVATADRALYQAKEQGRDRTVLQLL